MSLQQHTQRKGLQFYAPQGLPTQWWSPSQSRWHPSEMCQDLSLQLQSPAGIRGPISEDVPAALFSCDTVCKTGFEIHPWDFQRAAPALLP